MNCDVLFCYFVGQELVYVVVEVVQDFFVVIEYVDVVVEIVEDVCEFDCDIVVVDYCDVFGQCCE